MLLCAGFSAQTARRYSSSPARHLSTSSELSASRGLTRTHSITQAAMLTAGFFAALGLFDSCALETRHSPRGVLLDNCSIMTSRIFWEKGILNTLTFLGACLRFSNRRDIAFEIRVRFGLGKNGRANSAPRTTCRLSDRRCSGRALLRALLHPTDSAPCFACRAVLRAALDPKDAAASLVITTFSHLCLVGAHHCCLLNLALASAGGAARTEGDGTLFARAFCSKRQDFRLGP
jgi:hypothetical protein